MLAAAFLSVAWASSSSALWPLALAGADPQDGEQLIV
jgi:hypothetical protein